MSHTHTHTKPNLTSNDINRSFIIGIGLNSIYVVVELIYGWKENSTALLSDAVHNIGDISGLLLAFLAFRLLKVKANNTFTYGFRKGSVLASFINSILLAFAIGAIAWEGIQHILHPVPTSGTIIMIVAAIGIVINFASALLFRNKKDADLNIKAAYWHLMADALVSLGVVIAGLIIKYTDWYFVDGIVAVIVAGVILFSTWSLFKDSIIGILDGVPSNIDTDEITHHLLEIKGVKEIHHIHIWSISTNENGLTCHVKIDDLENIPSIKEKIKKELEEHNILHSTLEFEINTENCNG
ncbi:cation diffusion facilitator family transporter [Yeosuana marina]|uniref:cation diffusion facilitator family transporter n=1 Tax=Yeosuana marina TaxID=1565536 RepID=UPI00141FD1D9|nr:cation diffusion facilitator family transporter [Yeosuana marina]